MSSLCMCTLISFPLFARAMTIIFNTPQETVDEPTGGGDPRRAAHDDGQDIAAAGEQERRQHCPGESSDQIMDTFPKFQWCHFLQYVL